jgi:hypothetical protein
VDEAEAVGPRPALRDEQISRPDLARVHRDAAHLDVRTVQRQAEGGGQLGE